MNDILNRPCVVCGATQGHAVHYPQELMFGTREVFEYLECGYCGCLQIGAIPDNMAKHYPSEGYYSFAAPKKKNYPAWVLNQRKYRSRYFLGEFSLAGKLFAAFSKESEHFAWFRKGRLKLDSSIVDIGCGAGKLLLKLQREGFSNLLGIDPFLNEDIDYRNGVRILKRELGAIDQQYDFVMLHHAYEHMPDPLGTLVLLRQIVRADGALLIRIPVADSYARRRYGIHWHAWDPPRHFYLHTVRSMHILAEKTGFRIDDVSYDSRHSQFSTSELYLRGLSNKEHSRYYPGNGPDAFTEGDWAFFAAKAAELNRARDGDTACFILRPN